MKPIDFPGSNVVFAKDQPEYLPLPAYIDVHDPARPVTSCWELSEEELQEVLRTRRVFLQLLTFGKPLQPILITTSSPIPCSHHTTSPSVPPTAPQPGIKTDADASPPADSATS